MLWCGCTCSSNILQVQRCQYLLRFRILASSSCQLASKHSPRSRLRHFWCELQWELFLPWSCLWLFKNQDPKQREPRFSCWFWKWSERRWSISAWRLALSYKKDKDVLYFRDSGPCETWTHQYVYLPSSAGSSLSSGSSIPLQKWEIWRNIGKLPQSDHCFTFHISWEEKERQAISRYHWLALQRYAKVDRSPWGRDEHRDDLWVYENWYQDHLAFLMLYTIIIILMNNF
jgi:hypothetical protein